MKIPENFKTTAQMLVPFTEEELVDVISHFKERKVKKKEILLNYGQISKEVFFIEKGILREYYLENENEKTTWILSEGFFTYSLGSFMEQKGSKYRIEALEDGVIYSIGKSEYEKIVFSNKKVLLFNFLVQQIYLLTYEHRMELLRSNDAVSKYNSFLAKEGHLEQRVADKHIASYLGMTAATLSKTRRKKMLEKK